MAAPPLHSVAYGLKHKLSARKQASRPQFAFTQILLSKSAFDQNFQLGRNISPLVFPPSN